MPTAHVVFGVLAQMLGTQPFFAGDSLSLADVLLAPQLDFFRETPEWVPLTANTPNLRRWLDRMNSRPSLAGSTWERVAAMSKVA